MMRIAVLFFFFGATAFAQPAVEGFDLKASNFYGVDDFGSLYYGTDDVFYKKTGKEVKQFYDIQLGDLSSVDLINPLKVLLFYKDTQTVVLLDNRLNETQRISLNELTPYRFFEHAALAGERRLWLHDLDQNRLQLYDYINDRVIVNSPVLKNNIKLLLSDYNFCHVISENSVHTFNTYGSETSALEINAVELLDYDFGKLVTYGNDQIKAWWLDKEFRFRESETTTNTSIEKPVKSLYVKGGKLYIWSGKRVRVYDLNLIKK
jgi:hypothetical protein